MKALEICVQALEEEKERVKRYEHLSSDIPFIESAIAELEALRDKYIKLSEKYYDIEDDG